MKDLSKLLGKTVTVIVDRPLGSYHPDHPDLKYLVNYGYISNMIAADNEEQDAYILGVDHIVKEFTGIVIAIIIRNDDIENKLVVAASNDYTKEEIIEKTNFIERYFDTEIILLN